MKRIVSLAVAIIVLVASVPVYAVTLATESGYADCYNILEGFEGDKNAAGQRRDTNGWCAAGLPWQQG